MRFPLVLMFLFGVAALGSASTLYSIGSVIPRNSGKEWLETMKLNPFSGGVTNVTTNMIFDGSAPGVAVSTFDQKHGRYYFALGRPLQKTSLIYGTDTKSAQPLPSQNIGAEVILDMTFDPHKEILYTIYLTADKPYQPILAGVTSGEVRPVLEIPASFSVVFGLKGVINSEANAFYLAGKTGPLNTGPTYSLATINLDDGKIAKTVDVNRETCLLYPAYLWFDQATGLLFGGGETYQAGTVTFWFIKINPTTGGCTKTYLKASRGISTDWTFDPATEELYFVEYLQASGSLLNSYNIGTGVLNYPVAIDRSFHVESVEISTY